ncbi:MAG: biotin/lipoyl-binding protein [Cyclobacteriaceae bacterium]|nr:biotin/lipoyl-binding protein [Cyclobacteriaceae bacterium]
MRINWFYILTGALFFTMLFISSRYFRGSGDAAIGLAQSIQYKISSEKAALVKSVQVVPGMQVKEGDSLIKLTSQELEIEIAKLSNRIAVLKSEQTEKAKLTEAEIAYIKAENSIVIEELDAEILQTTSELKLNEDLTREFVSAEKNLKGSPLEIKINSLEKQKQKHLLAQEIKIRDIRQVRATEQHQLENQVVLLESELKLFLSERENLVKVATAPGVIKNVFVKADEQVSAYTQLLEINPLRPTTVVIYLVGKRADRFPVGATVTVSSYDQLRNSVSGKVIGYGSVVELPSILQKSTAVKAFGQEVFIEIPGDNNLANGEKILVR